MWVIMRRGAPASLVIAGGGGGEMLLKISSKLWSSTTPFDTAKDIQKQEIDILNNYSRHTHTYILSMEVKASSFKAILL